MKLENVKIKHKLLWAFGVILLIGISLGALTSIRINSIADESKQLSDQIIPKVKSLGNIERNWHLSIIYFRTFNTSKRSVDYYQFLSYLSLAQKELYSLTSEESINETTLTDFNNLTKEFDSFKNFAQDTYNSHIQSNTLNETNLIDRINIALKEITESNIWALQKIANNNSQATSSVLTLLIIGNLLSILLVLVISNRMTISLLRPIKQLLAHAHNLADGVFISIHPTTRGDEFGELTNAISKSSTKFQSVIDELQQLSIHLTKISKYLDLKSESLSETTNNQASQSEEVTLALQNIKSILEINSNHAAVTNQNMEKFATLLHANITDILESVNTMNQLITKTEEIKTIAFQTNILALNASIEAAKAGHQGKGFGVVAKEIVNLAEQTKQLSRDINTIGNVGVEISASIQQNLIKIETDVKQTSITIKEMSIAGFNQLNDVIQVQESLKIVNSGIQRTAINATEISEQSGLLHAETLRIKQNLSFFKNGDIDNFEPTTTSKTPAIFKNMPLGREKQNKELQIELTLN